MKLVMIQNHKENKKLFFCARDQLLVALKYFGQLPLTLYDQGHTVMFYYTSLLRATNRDFCPTETRYQRLLLLQTG